MTTHFVGLDFGTTNSALAVATSDGGVRLAQFQHLGEPTHLFRSVLYFSFERRDAFGRACTYAGPQAIERYLEEDGNGRLIISPKSSLASSLFDATQVLHTRYKQEDLVALLLRHLRESASQEFEGLGEQVVAGRPVRFAGARTDEDEQRALSRLTAALHDVGFRDVTFEYEPVAAASSYEATLDRDELVLVADFGGGTTDFCVIQVGPSAAALPQSEKILATGGVGIAGDNFDSRIVDALIAPCFGKGTQHRATFGDALPVPVWPYGYLKRWYMVGFLSEPKTLNMLYELHRSAQEPKKIRAFIDFIEGNLGLYLYQTTEATKVELSTQEASLFRFTELPEPLEAEVVRSSFEAWIDEDVREIGACCDGVLEDAGLAPGDIDRVFLTGGTSFVPKVRQLFLDRFGPAKLGSGNELTSVVSGLARRAQQIYG